jgi:hypothetical protein
MRKKNVRGAAASGTAVQHTLILVLVCGLGILSGYSASRPALDEREPASGYELVAAPTNAPAALAGSYRAVNDAQGFVTYFTPRNLRIVPLDASSARWQAEIGIASYDFGETPQSVEPSRVSMLRDQIEYAISRDLTASWKNTERGLEQELRFERAAAPGVLRFDLAVEGDLLPEPEAGGESVPRRRRHEQRPGSGCAARSCRLHRPGRIGASGDAWREGCGSDRLEAAAFRSQSVCHETAARRTGLPGCGWTTRTGTSGHAVRGSGERSLLRGAALLLDTPVAGRPSGPRTTIARRPPPRASAARTGDVVELRRLPDPT